jgi:SPP1 family predicted phage head-tail adaptor
MLKAGELRTTAIIEVATNTTSSEDGSRITTWATYRTVHAKIETVIGSTIPFSGSYISTATHRVSIRWIAGIKPGQHRLNIGGVTYAIIAALEMDSQRIQLDLLCTEVVQ